MKDPCSSPLAYQRSTVAIAATFALVNKENYLEFVWRAITMNRQDVPLNTFHKGATVDL
jgi:hypothetical protein